MIVKGCREPSVMIDAMKPLTQKILLATCLVLTLHLLCPAEGISQEASSSKPRFAVGFLLGRGDLNSRIPIDEGGYLLLGLSGFIPVSKTMGILGELSYGSWPEMRAAEQPTQWSGPPYDRGWLAGTRGRYFELHIGPTVRLFNFPGFHLFPGAMVGVRYFREKWRYFNPYRYPLDSREYSVPKYPSGPAEVHGTAQVRLRLAGDADAFGAALEASYIWSRRVLSNTDSTAYSRPDGLRLLLKIPLNPWAYGIERTTYQSPQKPATVYMRGVSGTFIGIVGGICAVESSLIVRGREPGKSSDFTVAIIAGGVVGSALGISRAREDIRLASVGARLAGGALAAVTETFIFSNLFDFDLPNPGLMLAVPLGSILGERFLIRH